MRIFLKIWDYILLLAVAALAGYAFWMWMAGGG